MMYLPYGVNESGQLVYIDQVGRGRTSLRCPYCGVRLIARKGLRLAPHFAHDGATCRQVKRADTAIALPVYDSFRLHLTGRQWEALRDFHDEGAEHGADELERLGFLKSFISLYGNYRYNLTHKGKIPFGELSLNLFNQFQEPLIRERYETLERAAWLALGDENEAITLIDLRLFRAQMRRILEATLYFIEVRTGAGVLHKIGVTTRPLEQRMAEIRRDLAPYFSAVDLVSLGTWTHRGNVELYFKYRYRRFQHPIGSLTEYFAFDDVKRVLRDLSRMKPKELMDNERQVLAGEASPVERRILQTEEMLSPDAWYVLCDPTDENINNWHGTWHELHNFRWKDEHRPLIEPTPETSSYQPRRTTFGETYYTEFAEFYKGKYTSSYPCESD